MLRSLKKSHFLTETLFSGASSLSVYIVRIILKPPADELPNSLSF